MSTIHTVAATPDAEARGSVASTIASLPLSFRPALSGETAQVAAIAGKEGWTSAAIRAIEAGAAGVLVVEPVPEDAGALLDAAAKAGAAVVLDERWASNPALDAARTAVRTVVGRAAMLDTVAMSAPGSDPEQLLAGHLAAVVQVTGPLDALRILHRGAHGYTAAARLPNGAPATLQGVISSARPAGVELRLYTNDGGVSVTVPDPHAAWPAEVRATASQGEILLPTLYETAHRAAWRRLKDHLDAGTLPAGLAGFARLARQLSHLA